MTRAEWDRIAVVLDYGWPGDFDEVASGAYWAVLGRREARDVEAAVRKAVDRGQRFRPTPPELVALIPATKRTVSVEAWRERYEAMYGPEKARELVAGFFPGGELNA
jgi:hypothetical protein